MTIKLGQRVRLKEDGAIFRISDIEITFSERKIAIRIQVSGEWYEEYQFLEMFITMED